MRRLGSDERVAMCDRNDSKEHTSVSDPTGRAGRISLLVST